MPLEVREIHVRLQVEDPESTVAASGEEGDPQAGPRGLSDRERAGLVEEVTRAVLAALAAREER